MTILKEILPFDLFKQMLDEGHIRQQVHPIYPELVIFNYTESATYDRVWNAATNTCRGLIVVCGPNGLDENAVVLSRPFHKFHNLNTEYVPESMEANLPTDALPLVTKKLDGSMGILYSYDGKLWVATRGSFDSEQARWATAWVRKHFAVRQPYRHWLPDTTPVFEIIYAENRIVVDYDFEGVVLLSIIDNASGREYPRDSVETFATSHDFNVVPKFDKSLAECAREDNPNEEGYVLTYPNGVKVKVKFAEYVRLHRILTGLNPKAVWEMLSAKQDEAIAMLLSDPKIPETFKVWLSGWVGQLRSRYDQLADRAEEAFVTRPYQVDWFDPSIDPKLARKTVAEHFQKTPDLCSILFAMLDDKDCGEIIWNRIRPKATDTFKVDV